MTVKHRRLILFAFLAQFFGVVGVSHAWMWQEAPEKTMTVRYRIAVAANISTAAVVIDLSDTVNWPHKQKGQINVSSYRLEFDKAAASTATAKIGVVNFVNVSSGSVTWFYAKEQSLNVSNTGNVDPLAFQPNFIQAKALYVSTSTDGTTPYILSNDTTSGSTIFQTDTLLPAPIAAGAAPGVGDIVLFVQNGLAPTVVEVEIQYHTLN